MNPYEGEVCKNGHTRTAENTSSAQDWYNDNLRFRLLCLDCNHSGEHTQRGAATRAAFWNKVANLDELMTIGAPKDEIVVRSGWKNLKSMRASLQRKNQHEILERYRAYS